MQPWLTTVDVVYGLDILRGDAVPKNQMELKLSLLGNKEWKIRLWQQKLMLYKLTYSKSWILDYYTSSLQDVPMNKTRFGSLLFSYSYLYSRYSLPPSPLRLIYTYTVGSMDMRMPWPLRWLVHHICIHNFSTSYSTQADTNTIMYF